MTDEKKDIRAQVREYYGKTLGSSDDLKTNACCCATARPPKYVLAVMPDIADEIVERFYGCGSPIPPALTGATVVDLGCGTGRDLSSWGNLLTMALVGVILASVVNLFLRSEMLMWIVTYVGILLFVGLTAYDTQTIKRMIYSGAEVDEPMQKMALLGALSLYLDFINLFLYMLRLLGNRR